MYRIEPYTKKASHVTSTVQLKPRIDVKPKIRCHWCQKQERLAPNAVEMGGIFALQTFNTGTLPSLAMSLSSLLCPDGHIRQLHRVLLITVHGRHQCSEPLTLD